MVSGGSTPGNGDNQDAQKNHKDPSGGGAGSVSIGVYSVDRQSFIEGPGTLANPVFATGVPGDPITWDNSPRLSGPPIASTDVSGTGVYSWDVTRIIRQAVADGQTSVVFALEGQGSSNVAVFGSRESGNGPTLTVDPGTTPSPVPSPAPLPTPTPAPTPIPSPTSSPLPTPAQRLFHRRLRRRRPAQLPPWTLRSTGTSCEHGVRRRVGCHCA